jgi:hypothetical protein
LNHNQNRRKGFHIKRQEEERRIREEKKHIAKVIREDAARNYSLWLEIEKDAARLRGPSKQEEHQEVPQNGPTSYLLRKTSMEYVN